MPARIQREVRRCPIYKMGPMNVWANCPTMEMIRTPEPEPSVTDYGCSAGACLSEVREIELLENPGVLQQLFPNYTKIPRDTAVCPLMNRGQIEELHSSERLFLANDTEETHLIRLYLLIVTVPNTAQFYWPVGFEVTGYQPGMQLPVVIQTGGESPEYSVGFSSMTFDVLVERNQN